MSLEGTTVAVHQINGGSELLHSEIFRRGALLALLMKKHMLAVGPPGHAKTDMAEELFQALDLEEDQTCVISGYKGAGEEILINYLHPGKLEKGEYEYLPGKSLLNSVLAYVDEVGAMSRVAQQSLLQIMQSRRFSRAGIDRKLPLDVLFAGGNSAPEDPAVRDRFAIQIPVELPRTAYMELTAWEPRRQKKGTISWQAVLELRAAVKQIGITTPARQFAVELAEKFHLSPRRVVEALIPAAKAWAVSEGRTVTEAAQVELAAPFVVMHEGELSMERFLKLDEELGEQRRRAAALEEIYPWQKKLAELQDMPQGTEATTLVKLRAAVALRKALPVPEKYEDRKVAEQYQALNESCQEWVKVLARELGLM